MSLSYCKLVIFAKVLIGLGAFKCGVYYELDDMGFVILEFFTCFRIIYD